MRFCLCRDHNQDDHETNQRTPESEGRNGRQCSPIAIPEKSKCVDNLIGDKYVPGLYGSG